MWYDSEDIISSPSSTSSCLSRSDPNPQSSISSMSNPINNTPSTMCRPSVVAQKATIAFEMPANFYWAIPGKIIGMACPLKRRHIENLQNNHNVALVVNLREVATPQQFFSGTSVRNMHVPIKSFGVPSMKQVEQFIDDLEGVFLEHRCDPDEVAAPSIGAAAANTTAQGNSLGSADAMVCTSSTGCASPSSGSSWSLRNTCASSSSTSSNKAVSAQPRTVAINCRGGKGRTGTMVCCYMVYKQGITAYEAITRVRELSPGSIETRGQEEFIEEYYRLRCNATAMSIDDATGTDAYKRSLPYEYDPSRNNGRICPTSGTIVTPTPVASRGNETRAKRPSYPARDMLLANPELLAKFGRFNNAE